MSSVEPRERWRSSWSFTLAAAGSAVGLGNLWKFPYIAWDHGGGGFILVYLVCVAALGFPLMAAEIVIGRAAQRSAVEAYARLGSPRWRAAGWLGVTTSVVVFSFYAVVAGWSLYSFARCVRWSWVGYVSPPASDFGAFVSNGPLQVGLGAGFIAITAVVVARGVRHGIDAVARVLMPGLFVVLLYMLATALTLPGAREALRFSTTIDFSNLDRAAVLTALGHAFFTLSVGIGAMIAYGSYLDRGHRILRVAATVTALDTAAAVVACGILFPIVFSVPSLRTTLEAGEVSSVSMLFVTLPDLFYRHLPGGALIAPAFFLLVAFAALSSTIPPLELVATTLMERRGWSRRSATWIASGGIALSMSACALSLGAVPALTAWRPFGRAVWLNRVVVGDKVGVLAVFDHLSANWLLPLGGLAVCTFAGWVVSPETVADELGRDATGRLQVNARIWRFFVRWICPAAILWILVSVLRGGDFT